MAAVVAFGAICWSAADVRGQDDEKDKPADKPTESRPAELPAAPDVLKEGTLKLDARLYLPDGKGEPRFVPNMRLGELLEIVRAQALRSEGAELPAFVFDELNVEVRAQDNLADIKVRAQVTLSDIALPVTDIPLRLQSCQLSEPITFEGSGKSQWQVGRSEPGYTWSLQAEPNTTHAANLVGQSALLVEGDRQSLQLTLPAAPTTIVAYLPSTYQDIRVRGQGGELLRSESAGNETRVEVRCIGGDVNLSWRSGDSRAPSIGASEVLTKTRWRIDDPSQWWEAESEISVRAYGELGVENLDIELPTGATWLPLPTSPNQQFTISAEDGPQAAKPSGGEPVAGSPLATRSAGDARRVRLRIRSNTRSLSSLETIVLRWRWQPPQSVTSIAPAASMPAAQAVRPTPASIANIVVPTIHVLAVDRHEGTTTLVIPAAFALDWKVQPGTEWIQRNRMDDVQEQTQYDFRFVRQPQSLVVSFRREENLAEVRPTYYVELDRERVKLTGWYQCAFDRSQSAELALDLQDWKLNSAELISDMASPYAEGEFLSQRPLPDGLLLLSNDLDAELSGTSRRVRQLWRIVAYRELNRGSIEHLKLQLPGIVLTAANDRRIPIVPSGALLIAASDNVLLSWDEQRSQSLLADAISSEWTNLLPQAMAERAMAFRFQTGAEKSPAWSGRVEVLPRRIAIEQTATVTLEIDSARLTQNITLQIANEPLERMRIVKQASQSISVLINGVPCVLEESTAESPGVEDADRSTLTVVGPMKLIGKVSVEIRSQISTNIPLSKEEETIFHLPFVELDLPEAAVSNFKRVAIAADRHLQVSISKQNESRVGASGIAEEVRVWSPIPTEPFDLLARENGIDFSVRRYDAVDPLPVRISAAWLQTSLNGNTRLDRFCARFQTNQDNLMVSLPKLDALNVQFAIDGISQSGIGSSANGKVQLNLQPFNRNDEHVLEIWTWSTADLGWLNRLDVFPVRIEGCQRMDRFYWQLVTPPNYHLALLPTSVTPEWRWVWDRIWWQRQSQQDQSYFENWIGAVAQPPLPVSANDYVVSSYGSVPAFQCWIASRLCLWFPTGMVAIAMALAASLWRGLRHPFVLIVLAGLLLAVAAQWPDLAILLGQTCILAMVIALLFALTQAAVESRVRRRSVFTTRPISGTLDVSDHPSLLRTGSQNSVEIVSTTRTQTPIATESGGH